MKCVNCKSNNTSYDVHSEMWYCKDCNSLFSSEEVLDEDGDWEDKDLNGFSMIVLHIMQMIPLLNILVSYIVDNSEVKKEYKKCFNYKTLSQLLVFTLVAVMAVIGYKHNTVEKLKDTYYTISGRCTELKESLNKSDVGEVFSSTESKSYKDLLDEIDSYVVVDDSDKSSRFYYLDGVVLDGDICQSIVQDTDNESYSYLIQSRDISKRYGTNSYRNVGYILNTSSYEESNRNYFYVVGEDNDYSRYTDDYGEFIYEPVEDLFNKKYIYYLNPNKEYVITILHEEDLIVGLIFKEVF